MLIGGFSKIDGAQKQPLSMEGAGRLWEPGKPKVLVNSAQLRCLKLGSEVLLLVLSWV